MALLPNVIHSTALLLRCAARTWCVCWFKFLSFLLPFDIDYFFLIFSMINCFFITYLRNLHHLGDMQFILEPEMTSIQQQFSAAADCKVWLRKYSSFNFSRSVSNKNLINKRLSQIPKCWDLNFKKKIKRFAKLFSWISLWK